MMIKNRKRVSILSVLFVAALLLPILMFNKVNGKVSETEKRNLAKFPDVFDTEGHLSGTLKDDFVAWLNDNIGFRSQFVELAATVKGKLFHQYESLSDRVEVGADGWLFYTESNNLDIARGTYPGLEENVLAEILEQQTRIQNKLAQRGIDYALVLPPSKPSIYPEYILSGEYDIHTTPVDILSDYLKQHSDIKVIPLKNALLEAKDQGTLYFKTDTHWSELGAYYGYREVIERLREYGLPLGEPAEIDRVEKTRTGDLSLMIGNNKLYGDEKYLGVAISEPTAVKKTTEEEYVALDTALKEQNPNVSCVQFSNDIDAPTVLIFGDSYFGSFNVAELFAENFSEVTYVWDPWIYETAVDMLNPDIVLFECVERSLNILVQKSRQFVQEPLQNLSAELSGYEMTDRELTVSVQNLSDETWKYIDRVGLAIQSNGNERRALVTAGEPVGPGEIAQFVFEDIDNTWLENGIDAQMLQDGISYLGDKWTLQF